VCHIGRKPTSTIWNTLLDAIAMARFDAQTGFDRED